jgi:hypothetical protein
MSSRKIVCCKVNLDLHECCASLSESPITNTVQVYLECPIHTAPATPDGYKSKPLLILHMSTYCNEQFFLK